MMHHEIPERTKSSIAENRIQDLRLMDGACFALRRAKGMVGLIGDVATFGQGRDIFHEVDLNNVEQAAKEAEMTIKEVITLLESLSDTRNEG